MPGNAAKRGEQQSVEALGDRVRAWWISVLAGQLDQSHPVYGTNVSAHLDADTMVISGTVTSARDKEEIEREIDLLRGKGFQQVQNLLEVKPDGDEESGLLVQTLISAFENEEQAGFAEGYLEGHAQVRPEAMRVVAPKSDRSGREAAHAMLPEAYWGDAEKALRAGRTLLIVTVDETRAFKARELLDEETRSLETVVLPPEPARNAGTAREGLESVASGSGDAEAKHMAEAARRRARGTEGAVHER